MLIGKISVNPKLHSSIIASTSTKIVTSVVEWQKVISKSLLKVLCSLNHRNAMLSSEILPIIIHE